MSDRPTIIVVEDDTVVVNRAAVQGRTGPTGATGPQGIPGDGHRVIPFGREGDLVPATGKGKFKFTFPVYIEGVSAAVNTAPTGSSIVLDVNKILTGSTTPTSIFTNQSNRPTIPDGLYEAAEVVPDVHSFAPGDMMTVDIDSVGSVISGADLVVSIRWRPA